MQYAWCKYWSSNWFQGNEWTGSFEVSKKTLISKEGELCQQVKSKNMDI